MCGRRLIYREDHALMQQIELSKQDGPSKHDLRLLQDWLVSAAGNGSSLRGQGWDTWDIGQGLRDTEKDYIVLSSNHQKRDRFVRWTGDTLLGLYHRFIGRHIKVNLSFQD